MDVQFTGNAAYGDGWLCMERAEMKIQLQIEGKSGKTKIITSSGEIAKRIIDTLEAMESGSSSKLLSKPAPISFRKRIITPEIRELSKETLTIKERLRGFIKYEYPRVWFKSLDLKKSFEETFDTEISLSTISEYLARMHREGLLERRGNRTQWEYKLVEKNQEASVSQTTL
jgi:hypothetical protein